MRVYLQPPQPSRGLDRIAHALARYAPPQVEVCQFDRNVDLTVIYAIGRRDHIERQCREIVGRGKKYAIIQVCLRSTMSPSTWDWLNIWQGAHLIWSYYDLRRIHEMEDGAGCGYFETQEQMDRSDEYLGIFMHAPLGVDSSVFYPQPTSKDYIIISSGYNRLQESIRECYLAAEAVGMECANLGKEIKQPFVHSYNNIDDATLCWLYNKCHFVSGLRRTEGFELPAAEGLLCGARPIVFDTPDYRFNYREFAEYIHEGTRAEVVDQLVQLFKQGARPVSEVEREEAAHWFNWERVCGEFWARCLQ